MVDKAECIIKDVVNLSTIKKRPKPRITATIEQSDYDFVEANRRQLTYCFVIHQGVMSIKGSENLELKMENQNLKTDNEAKDSRISDLTTQLTESYEVGQKQLEIIQALQQEVATLKASKPQQVIMEKPPVEEEKKDDLMDFSLEMVEKARAAVLSVYERLNRMSKNGSHADFITYWEDSKERRSFIEKKARFRGADEAWEWCKNQACTKDGRMSG
jgi:hypothetical protein